VESEFLSDNWSIIVSGFHISYHVDRIDSQ
jgi:hypothetical protein